MEQLQAADIDYMEMLEDELDYRTALEISQSGGPFVLWEDVRRELNKKHGIPQEDEEGVFDEDLDDDFYNEYNQAIILKSINELKAGKGRVFDIIRCPNNA